MPSPASPAGAPSAARFLHFAATVSLSGLVIFHAFIGAPALSAGDAAMVRPIAGRLARLAWGSLVLAVLTGGAALLVQAAGMGERSLAGLWSDDLVATVLLDTDFGHVWLARLMLVVLLAAALRPPYFGAESHGDGTPTRMSREKSGDWSASFAWALMRARSINSLSGMVVTTTR